MKPSHFQTPRTLEDATFYPWGDPMDVPQQQIPVTDVILYVLGVLSLILVYVIL